MGTETTIGDTTTQDDMFIRFSTGEQLNQFTPLATNSAGTQSPNTPNTCLLYTSPSPRDRQKSRMPSSA